MNKYKAIKVNGKKKDEHRHLMEIELGRELGFNECVHHKDGNKSNNSISNLEIIDRAEHSSYHMRGRETSTETKEKLRIAGISKRPNAKLSVEEVIQIKEQLKTKRQVDVSIEFGISKELCYSIKVGRAWAWA